MYERFTDRARLVIARANQEARYLNHEWLGTEHLLLGLLAERAGLAATLLRNLGMDIRSLRQQVGSLVAPGPLPVTLDRLPCAPSTKRVIEEAVKEARELGNDHVGTEHLLLGLLHEQEGVVAQVLTKLEINPEVVRREVVHLQESVGRRSPVPGSAGAALKGPGIEFAGDASGSIDCVHLRFVTPPASEAAGDEKSGSYQPVSSPLAHKVDRLVKQRDAAVILCAEILATLQLQRNQAPLSDAGIKLDEQLARWRKQFQEFSGE